MQVKQHSFVVDYPGSSCCFSVCPICVVFMLLLFSDSHVDSEYFVFFFSMFCNVRVSAASTKYFCVPLYPPDLSAKQSLVCFNWSLARRALKTVPIAWQSRADGCGC